MGWGKGLPPPLHYALPDGDCQVRPPGWGTIGKAVHCPQGKHDTIGETQTRQGRRAAMANRKGGKLWSPGTLKSRGWTKELMAQLLPWPRYRHWNGRSVPCWRQGGRPGGRGHRVFQKKARGTAPKGPSPPGRPKGGPGRGDPAGTGLAGCLPTRRTGAGTLAGYYHRAMVDHLPAAASGTGSRSSQVTGVSPAVSGPGDPVRQGPSFRGPDPLCPGGGVDGANPKGL